MVKRPIGQDNDVGRQRGTGNGACCAVLACLQTLLPPNGDAAWDRCGLQAVQDGNRGSGCRIPRCRTPWPGTDRNLKNRNAAPCCRTRRPCRPDKWLPPLPAARRQRRASAWKVLQDRKDANAFRVSVLTAAPRLSCPHGCRLRPARQPARGKVGIKNPGTSGTIPSWTGISPDVLSGRGILRGRSPVSGFSRRDRRFEMIGIERNPPASDVLHGFSFATAIGLKRIG